MTVPVPLEPILITILSLLAYLPCLNGPFLFDDLDTVLGNPMVLHGQLRQLLRVRWRPLTQWTLGAQALWPKTSRGYHIANALLHAVNALIVNGILRTLHVEPVNALLLACLFAVHPFFANSVAFVTARASMLSATFGVLGVWAILAGYTTLAAPCLVLAYLSKEDGVAFALTFSAVHLWTGSPWFWIWPVPVAVAAWHYREYLRWVLVRNSHNTMIEGGLPGCLPQPLHGFTVLVETVLHFPSWCLGLFQSPYHGNGIRTDGFRISVAILTVVLNALAFVLVPESRLPLILIYMSPWAVFVVAPTADQIAEYRHYASGLFIPLALAPIAGEWLLPVIAIFTMRTMVHASAWGSGLTMWTRATECGRGEKSRAWQEIGAEHKGHNRLDEAEVAFRQALRLNPRLAPALRNMAATRMVQGRPAEAIHFMEECTFRCPQHAPGWEDLGFLYEHQKNIPLAIDAYRQALRLNPKLEQAQNRLGIIAFNLKQYEAAALHFAAARKRQPNSHEYAWNLACTEKELGRMETAREILKTFPPNVNFTTEMVLPPDSKPELATC